MGLILDTSTLVTAERQGQSVRQIFAQLRAAHGEQEPGLSAVTIIELAHGIERAKLDTHRQRRQVFLDDLIADMTIYPLTTEIARLAGRISGQEAGRGITLPFEDLLIGATALQLGFEVVTENVRHFQMIPNLVVRQL
jgi:predicted nucleic acid-binding protein